MLYEQKICALQNRLTECEQQLCHSQKENEAFINLASHDLKSPLRKLSTFIARLRAKSNLSAGDNVSIYLDKIENTLEEMTTLIDSMSALAEIDTQKTEFKEVNLSSVVNNLIKEKELLLNEASATVSVSVLPVVQGDPAQLKIVFQQLFDNAVKFKSPAKPLQVKITSEPASANEGRYFTAQPGKLYQQVNFTDNGIGMKKEFAEQIFQPYFRLHGKSDYKGTGMGLAIAKKIMNRHFGNIYAEPIENFGTRIVLIFP